MSGPVHTGPTTSGLAPNVAGALAYLLGPLTGIIFLVIEKENRFVRFHAAQSTILGAAWIVFTVVLSIVLGVLAFIPVLGWLIGIAVSLLLPLAGLVLWLLLMFQAFSGREFEIPVIAPYARRMATRATAM